MLLEGLSKKHRHRQNALGTQLQARVVSVCLTFLKRGPKRLDAASFKLLYSGEVVNLAYHHVQYNPFDGVWCICLISRTSGLESTVSVGL